MQVDLSFGEYLRRLRRDKRQPLQDVARRSRLSTTHLSRLENDNGLPTTDTVVKLHRVLGGDLSIMLELAKCLPDEILDRYIRRADDEAPVLKRSALGRADDPIFAKAFIEDMDPAIRRAVERAFSLSERDAEGVLTALRRLASRSEQERAGASRSEQERAGASRSEQERAGASRSEQEREQVIGVLKLATQGVDA